MIRKFLFYTGIFGVSSYSLHRISPESTRPIMTIMNVINVGGRMLMIYKYSQMSMQQKNKKASKFLSDNLRKNGGIYLKLGQLIASLDVIVPDQFRHNLMNLTRNCQATSFEKVKKTIQEQLGKPIQQIFQTIQITPISSASIGQVHKAILRTGEQVAVKIQHSELSNHVHYDLILMKSFIRIAKIFFENFKYNWLVEQFQNNIMKQLDFKQQAQNMIKVSNYLKKQKINNVIIPKILYQPTKKVLIMQYINGIHIDQLNITTKLSKIGTIFSHMIVKMIHQQGFVHADPHCGNLMVRQNTQSKQYQLVLLDHGLYQSLKPAVKKAYNEFWLGMILNQSSIYQNAAQKLGTKRGKLLCSVLTSKPMDTLTNQNRSIFDLNPHNSKAEILEYAKKGQTEIVQILNQLPRQILLILKVNQFARTIENLMGGRPMGVYQDIAKLCVQNLDLSFLQRMNYYIRMFLAQL